MRQQRTILPVTLAAALLIAGCGKSSGTLVGKVTLNGEDLGAGQVTAYNDKAEPIAHTTIVEGRYSLTNLPLGSVTLVVQTHTPDGQPIGAPLPPPAPGERGMPPEVLKEVRKNATGQTVGDAKPVPLKYTNVKESGLTVKVVGGETKYDIAMSGEGQIPKLPRPGAMTGNFPPLPKGVPPPPGGFPPSH